MSSLTADERPAASWSRIVALCVVLMALMACERMTTSLRVPWDMSGQTQTLAESLLALAVKIGRYVAAGLLIDAFGPKRLVMLSIVAFIVLLMATGLVTDPLSLKLIDLLEMVAFAPLYVGVAVGIWEEIAPGRRALALLIFDAATYIWAAAAPALRVATTSMTELDPTMSRLWPAAFAAVMAIVVGFLWAILYPPDRAPPGEVRTQSISVLLRDRQVRILLALDALIAIVIEMVTSMAFYYFGFERGLKFETVGLPLYVPYGVAIVAGFAGAIWSDRCLARTGSIVAARRPLLILGLALSASIGLLPVLPADALLALTSVAAVGIGLQSIIAVVFLDIAAPGRAGALLGLSVAAEPLGFFLGDRSARVIVPVAHSYAPVLVLGALVAIVAMFVSFRIRDIQPLDMAAGRQSIPDVFS